MNAQTYGIHLFRDRDGRWRTTLEVDGKRSDAEAYGMTPGAALQGLGAMLDASLRVPQELDPTRLYVVHMYAPTDKPNPEFSRYFGDRGVGLTAQAAQKLLSRLQKLYPRNTAVALVK